MSCPHETAVAAYVLGTLDPPERDALTPHLAACAGCRSALEQVAGLPGLLARVPADVAAAGLPQPSPQLVDRVLAVSRTEVVRRRRRRLAALAVAASLVVAVAGAVLVQRGVDPGPRTVTATQGAVHASVRLAPASGGSDLALELTGVPAGLECRLVALSRTGAREVTATWQVAYTGQVVLSSHTRFAPEQVRGLVVETVDGRTLVTLPAQEASGSPGR